MNMKILNIKQMIIFFYFVEQEAEFVKHYKQKQNHLLQ